MSITNAAQTSTNAVFPLSISGLSVPGLVTAERRDVTGM